MPNLIPSIFFKLYYYVHELHGGGVLDSGVATEGVMQMWLVIIAPENIISNIKCIWIIH